MIHVTDLSKSFDGFPALDHAFMYVPKGAVYGHDECLHPTRTVTSIVRVSNREDIMVSVKTEKPIPKENIFDLMRIIRATEAKAPIAIGDVICKDTYGTDVIATKAID